MIHDHRINDGCNVQHSTSLISRRLAVHQAEAAFNLQAVSKKPVWPESRLSSWVGILQNTDVICNAKYMGLQVII